jgi:DNA replication protein DnaC
MEEKLSKEDFVDGLLAGKTFLPDEEFRELEEKRETEKKISLESLFLERVPSRYKAVKFDGDPKLLETERAVIFGPYGTGKTYLGYSIARELFVSGRIKDFQVVRERELYNIILEAQANKNMGQIRDKFFHTGLLVIDEYGKNSQTDAASSQIFNIIDYRYDWELRTILICNALNGTELKKIVPEAIQDRFKGTTYFLGGNSRRLAE